MSLKINILSFPEWKKKKGVYTVVSTAPWSYSWLRNKLPGLHNLRLKLSFHLYLVYYKTLLFF